MKTFLSSIRCSGKQISTGRQVVDTGIILLLGIALGIFSKFLDTILELLVFVCGAVVLRRNTVKDTICMLVSGVVMAFVLGLVLPFGVI